MYALLIVIYIVIATYYLIGITRCFKKIVRNDSVLRRFLMKCDSALVFACMLIILVSYAWPVIAAIKPFTIKFIEKNLHPPVNRVTRRKTVL